ncbi:MULTISPECIES: MarR family transcriptional regulator [Imperialibacter]|uniref:MarR family transcriptional regulator n=1 Tax=Imperialibacter roseus TaxID=1324217 RepID=A0ABZ0IME3_9BACT|nr:MULTISPECIES: MarR family transcriptional regulator [Imperialibacter]WOK06199.1 MarR family transcriptional regulator [Imperialibacter roseus]CAD5268902.1 MarR family transcriptional regulator [Imperialibacter sp. 89]CAD5297216.1 MarR family transcriptional regulator [Imperialibacter sp. 75]VVT34060.1 Transcriptional regulator, MarR family [Imperialibacter sp. EC-SDR9]|tara:strand:+ start:1195 stop:1671 length:477 start_codon:yes stop_codon:yes gene_type:complete
MKREETIDYNIKVAWHSIARMYNQAGQNDGITTSIGFVLLNIESEEGTPATKIAPLMGLEARSLTRMLKNMEERKLIYKMPDPNDGRSVRIFLTEKGKYQKTLSKRVVIAFNEMVIDQVEPEKLKVFFDVITQINQLIEDKQLIHTYINEEKIYEQSY